MTTGLDFVLEVDDGDIFEVALENGAYQELVHAINDFKRDGGPMHISIGGLGLLMVDDVVRDSTLGSRTVKICTSMALPYFDAEGEDR